LARGEKRKGRKNRECRSLFISFSILGEDVLKAARKREWEEKKEKRKGQSGIYFHFLISFNRGSCRVGKRGEGASSPNISSTTSYFSIYSRELCREK